MGAQGTMQTYAERLASFEVAYPATKKRTSSAKSAKSLRWPHKKPDPAQLAEAGFIFRPTTSAPDNATCFLCHMNLDGWEIDDDPVTEHVNLSSNCGWAINVCIERDDAATTGEDTDPTSESMIEARKMTFASGWPHEGKRGWKCQAQKMAEAGWYYCPTEESDDFVKCPYCNLSLDGWEPKDNPYEEHQRRSENCTFFSRPAPNAKSGRGRKARSSKVSRLSTQSNLTVAMENISIKDAEDKINESVVIVEDDSILPVKTSKGAKKGPKAKKAGIKAKGKAGKATAEESMQASSFIEPEDDNFEIKVVPETTKATRGRKRKSEEMHENPDITVLTTTVTEEPAPDRPAKRRVTRSRASAISTEGGLEQVDVQEQHTDSQMEERENILPASTVKRGTKGGRKRGSSIVRKASATSTASTAPLRIPVPDDAEIEAALEADLDRPLTDEEDDSIPQPITSTKTRRLTRTNPASKHTTASTAPTRRTTQASIVPEDMIQQFEPEPRTNATVEPQLDSSSLHQLTKGPKTRKVSKKPAHSSTIDASQAHESPDPVEETGVAPEQTAKSKPVKSRQTSRQVSARSKKAAAIADASEIGYPDLAVDSSIIASHAAEGESGHETDASIADQPAKKRGLKKGVKKTKAGKKAGIMSRNIEDIVQAEPEIENVDEEIAADAMIIDEPEVVDEQMPEAAPPSPAPAKAAKKKTAKSSKVKTSKAKPVVEEPPSSALVTDDPWAEEPLGESTPMPFATTKVPSPSRSSIQSIRTQTPLVASKVIEASPKAATPQRTPHQPTASPQSSDHENQPPSSQPSTLRPPLQLHSPSKAQTIRIPLATGTPTTSPSRRGISKLQTSMPWTAVDLEKLFLASPNPDADKENVLGDPKGQLTSPEKKMTVEEWIYEKARMREEELRNECERLVGRFEGEGVRALKSLEGIVCAE